jgi:hypothetical protein
MRIKFFLSQEMIYRIVFWSVLSGAVLGLVFISLPAASVSALVIAFAYTISKRIPRKLNSNTTYYYNGQLNGRLLLKQRFGVKITRLASVTSSLSSACDDYPSVIPTYALVDFSNIDVKDEVPDQTLWFIYRTRARLYSGKCYIPNITIGRKVKLKDAGPIYGIVAACS